MAGGASRPSRCLRAAAAAAAVGCVCASLLLPLRSAATADPAAAAAAGVTELEWGGRIVAVGDLHGDATNALLLLDALEVVDFKTRRWRGGTTMLVQTGDVVDRGPDGKRLYDLFVDLKPQAEAAGGKVVLLLGNHDAMNVCGDFRYAHPKETDEFGGLASRRAAFSDRGKYGSLLLSLPPAFKVNGIVFSHAGVSPQFASLGLRATQKLLREELKDGCSLYYKKHMGMGGSGPFAGGEDGPLWTRLYTLSPPAVSCPALEKALKLLQADLMVVGHTVQESLSVQAFCGGRLLAIDTGISRYVANSPRAIEITPEGVVHEVSVHSSLEAADEENSPPPKRRLLVQPLTFYTQKRSSNKHNPANAAAKAAAAYKREYYLQETMALDEL